MSRYAELYFAEKNEDIPVNKHLMNLSVRLGYRFINWHKVIKSQSISIWGIEGESIQLPMTYSMYRAMPSRIRNKTFQKIEIALKKRDVTHVILPSLVKTSIFNSIKEVSGNYTKPFFAMEVIHYVIDKGLIDAELEKVEIVILDGNKKEVDMLIDFIYPHINHLTILTDKPERFVIKSEEIFIDLGLNMQVLSYTKEAVFQGDIIIDTHYYDPLIINYCRKGALYLDFSNNQEKTVVLKEKQKNVLVIDKFLLIRNKEIASIKLVETFLDINNVFADNYKITKDKIRSQNIEIYKLVYNRK